MLLLSWTFLRAVISWWLNLIRALQLCQLLIDNLITVVCSLPILSSPFLLFLYSLSNLSPTLSTPFCSLLSLLMLILCLFPHFLLFSILHYFFFFTTPLSLVVLLDTTTVLGELDWKTYPVNGVSDTSISLK